MGFVFWEKRQVCVTQKNKKYIPWKSGLQKGVLRISQHLPKEKKKKNTNSTTLGTSGNLFIYLFNLDYQADARPGME